MIAIRLRPMGSTFAMILFSVAATTVTRSLSAVLQLGYKVITIDIGVISALQPMAFGSSVVPAHVPDVSQILCHYC